MVLIGTTTPNCIRATAYDANSLDYNVIVLEDATSAQTEEIQRVEAVAGYGTNGSDYHEFSNISKL